MKECWISSLTKGALVPPTDLVFGCGRSDPAGTTGVRVSVNAELFSLNTGFPKFTTFSALLCSSVVVVLRGRWRNVLPHRSMSRGTDHVAH